MQYTRIRRRTRAADEDAGVYADRDELMRLRFKASGFSFLPRQPIHSILSGRHASRLRGRGLNFEELRGYLRGDDPRHIDWKVTARTGKPHVRVYTEEKDRTVWLLVDQRISMFFGSRRRMKSVVAAEAAAVAAWRVLAQGDRVGALVFDDQEIRVIEPLRSEQRVAQILDCIIEKNHALNARSGIVPNPGMLNQVLRRACELVRHDSLVSVITDAAGIDPQTTRYITRLSAHNDVLFAFIYDPLEQALPDAGRLTFTDGRTQVELNTAERKLRDAYGAEFERRLQRMSAASRRHSIPLLAVHTAAPVLDQVRGQLGTAT
jgi:uncharacterized protein (DUF58 family)